MQITTHYQIRYKKIHNYLLLIKQYLFDLELFLNKNEIILDKERTSKTIQPLKSILFQIYNIIIKELMSSYDSFIQNKSFENEQNCLENVQELFFDLQKHLDLDYQQNKDPVNKRTNYSENQQEQAFQLKEYIKCIDIPKKIIKDYLSAKKGRSTQTMELLPNFKTFITRKIKELLLIKILNNKQIHNCIIFMKSKPSFKALCILLHPLTKCQQLQKHLLYFFSSAQLIRLIMESSIRLSEKQKMIKFIEQIRSKVRNPQKKHRWKNLYK